MTLYKILALIPARGGSKGIPGKNIKLLGGKPLIAHAAQSALGSPAISRLVISTDSEEIAQVARLHHIEVPFIRPQELSLDTTPSIDVMIHALNHFKKIGEEFDAICLLQATSPFKPKNFVNECIQIFIDSGADSFISVLRVPHEYNPHWTFEKNESGELRIATGEKELIPRRQELPTAFFRDGSVYITKTDFLLQERKIVGGKIVCKESDPNYYCNLDTPSDWDKAEKMVLQNPQLLP
jgi:CMP-N,N'-diacetyllegionaminic acid synthase